VLDDPTPPPKPRPRRRRTDIDPNAPSPPVANERRRSRMPEGESRSDVPPIVAAAAIDAVVDPSPPSEGTREFHVPGMAAVAAAGVASVGAAATGAAATGATASGAAATGAATTGAGTDGSGSAGATAVADGGSHEGGPDAVEGPEVPGGVATGVREVRPSWLAVLDDRSPDPDICPFLRAADQGSLTVPIERADPANRCAALAEAVPQSLRQQELVCLTTGHINCPRYLRGAAVMTETPTPVVREGRAMSPAMLGSLVVLVMALSASVAFVLARGGALSIGPTGSPVASAPVASAPVAVVSPSVASLAPAASPSVIAQATPTPAPTPTPTAAPTPSPSPKPTPDPTPRRTARPSPSSDRYQLLRACPGTPRCYIYRVRSGDNLFSIAHYFGVSMDSLYARNPWLRNSGLRAGQQLRMPPPTR
jgi:LysM domain